MRHFLALSVLAATLVAPGLAEAETTAKPNIVFIIADDLGWGDVGFHGGPAPTPNLDRMARDGVELTQHYVAPVCSPTRTGLMTGRWWSRYGVVSPQNERALPRDTLTLPKALRAAGYDTCLAGKWHLGSKAEWGPNHFGFDHSYGSMAGGVGPWNHVYKTGPFRETWHRNGKLLEETGHVTDLIAGEAVRWIEGRKDKPFFLYVPFTAVHLPIKEPDEYLKRVPASVGEDVPRHYAACVMHLDDAVGRIVAALEKAGKRENTLLVFTSDNGGSTAENNDTKYTGDTYPQGKLAGNNAPFRGGKGDLYEGGIRVPAVVSWPGRLKAKRIDAPVHIADWMPTLCSLAGSRPDQDPKWDGTDVSGLLNGKADSPARTLYWVAPGWRARAVRHGDWKLVAHGDGPKRKVELYDLARDPKERTDLSATDLARVTELLGKLDALARGDRESAPKD